jgi:Zn-dependent protease with chaperone function
VIITALGMAVVLLAVPGLARTAPRGLKPAQWAKAIIACLVIGAVVLEVALLLLGASTVLQVVDDAAFASACKAVIDRLAPGGPLVGWGAVSFAGFVIIGTTRATARALRRTRTARIEPCLGVHIDRGAFDLVILQTERLVAVGVPGSRPQVVVSEGLVRALTSEEIEAVIRHEAAHHSLGHHRYLLVASILEQTLGWLPLVHRSTGTLRKALEEWADDAATGVAGSRSGELRDAIIGVACAKATHEAPAIRVRSSVIDRADRLGQSDRRRTLVAPAFVYTGIAAMAVVTLVLVVDWLTTTHHALALSGYCPT